MQYLAITSLEQLAAHRDAWDALYRADPRAQLFLSSAWLRAHLALVPAGWTIHVLRDGDEFVAALPTATRPIPHPALPIARELRFPTDPLADYQSMLCRPGREREAIAAFVERLAAARWDRIALRHVHDPRIAELAERLARRSDVRLRQGAPATCYQLDLPATYDEFLERLSKPTRRATKRGLKMLDELRRRARHVRARRRSRRAHRRGRAAQLRALGREPHPRAPAHRAVPRGVPRRRRAVRRDLGREPPDRRRRGADRPDHVDVRLRDRRARHGVRAHEPRQGGARAARPRRDRRWDTARSTSCTARASTNGRTRRARRSTRTSSSCTRACASRRC